MVMNDDMKPVTGFEDKVHLDPSEHDPIEHEQFNGALATIKRTHDILSAANEAKVQGQIFAFFELLERFYLEAINHIRKDKQESMEKKFWEVYNLYETMIDRTKNAEPEEIAEWSDFKEFKKKLILFEMTLRKLVPHLLKR